MECSFWELLEEQIKKNGIIIDRKKGTARKRFSGVRYPTDYGFIPGTTASDRGGIDLFSGTSEDKRIVGLFCTFDELKKDAELKLLYACTLEEIEAISIFLDVPHHAFYVSRGK